jgi:hypothetical protein
VPGGVIIFGLTPLAFEEPVTCLGGATVTLGRFMTGPEAPGEVRTYWGPTLAFTDSTPVDACPFAPLDEPSLLASLLATGVEPDASTSPNLNATDAFGAFGEGSTELGVRGAGGETGGTVKLGGLPFEMIGGFIPTGGGIALGLITAGIPWTVTGDGPTITGMSGATGGVLNISTGLGPGFADPSGGTAPS